MSRYTNYNKNEPYNDGWMDTSDHYMTDCSDHVCHPVVLDAQGRKNPIIRYTPGHNSEGYVAKAEMVVEHVTPVPVFGFVRTNYRHSSEPAEKELTREYAVDKLHSQLASTYGQSEKVESFLTKIQAEVSQPNKGTGFNSSWSARAPPNPTVQDGNGAMKNGDDKDFIKGSNNAKKVNSFPVVDKQEKGYFPIISNNRDMGERPNEGPIGHNRPLSKPTNDINTAVEFLTQAVNPIQSDVRRPTNAPSLSPVHWRNGDNFAAQGPKLDLDEDDLEKQQEQNMYRRDNLGTSYRKPVDKINNKDYNENDKRNGFGNKKIGNPTVSPMQPSRQTHVKVQPKQVKEVNFYTDTIDSSEARKLYGKSKPSPVPEDAYRGAITSEELIKRYNGAKVPW